jgi:hypothetical protein
VADVHRAKLQRLGGGVRGHQIPAGRRRQVIERGEFARHMVRLVVAGGRRGDQADALGHRAQGREQGQRFEMIERACGWRWRVGAARCRRRTCVEAGRFGNLRQTLVAGEVQPALAGTSG